MAITKTDFSTYIKAFQFRELFNEMGWNNDRSRQPIIVDDSPFNLGGIAEKSGFKIFVCEPAPGCNLPDKATRKKIEGKVTKLFQEHLIIFIDEQRRDQVWQLAVRKAGSPTKISETRYSLSQDPELLYQRASGLFFTLDEEEKVTIIDVTKRVAENFQQNNEKVTKKFYESFKKEHIAFMKFIQGINDQLHIDWYASLMLNRLMFCYFIQKKGFLDNNKNYLQDKLNACKEKKGKNRFYSFYRDFLLALFHKGLGAPEHAEKLQVEIGKIPYLNGGLFDEHEIEKTFKNIHIEDSAFEKLFNFFDQYEWHLDTRETASGKDINPDVIGYIFEKYINDRAQMGAYYTKEDITDYISRNCIIPWLFDEVKRHYPQAFTADNWLWQMVKVSGGDYIYDAVKYGVPENGGLFHDLPDEIQTGFAPELEKKVVDGNGSWLWELRKSWNKPAPSDIALPTEIYREVIERRKRFADLKTKTEHGEIKEINEFITYNLNIRQFAQDVIETTEDAKFIRHFYKALSGISILDPTCGSGAFLFAAMNILQPLYEACIRRMKNFIDESGRGKHAFFEDTLAQVNAPEHPNLQYFIYKSIILNNLYGVDIMNEAVEIAKLRLFLKLVATVDANYRKPNLGLEPLPDVDFNIRAGNTLVGYTTKKQIDDVSGLFVTDAHRKRILEQCDMVAHAFARYKEIQLSSGDDYNGFKQAKDDLNDRLKKLTAELDGILYMEQYKGVNLEEQEYGTWLATHQPFHWFAEFYEIVAGKGGFDVVIGNPPYVEYKNVNYEFIDFLTKDAGNLYAPCIERSINIIKMEAYMGVIIPLSGTVTPRMESLIKLFNKKYTFISNFSASAHPSTLFSGVKQRISIVIIRNIDNISNGNKLNTSFLRWSSEERNKLFESKINYYENNLKISSQVEYELIKKMSSCKKFISHYIVKLANDNLYYHNAPVYWNKVFNFVPYFYSDRDGVKQSVQVKTLPLLDNCINQLIIALNSTLFYWYFYINSDCWHLTNREIYSFPIDCKLIEAKISKNFVDKLMKNLSSNSKRYKRISKDSGAQEFDSFYPVISKPIIDQIDSLLAQHYGFTHEELDFIINYDIKYRMGKELNSGEDEKEE